MPGRRPPARGAAVALLLTLTAADASAVQGYVPGSTHWTSPFGTLSPALGRFETLATAKRPQDLPRLVDPDAGPVLRTIWAAAEPDYTALPEVELEAMATTTIEEYELDVLVAYLDFPAKPPLLAELPASPPSPADADRIATRFGPELAHSLAAVVAAVAYVSVTAEHYRVATPAPGHVHPAEDPHVARAPNLRIVALAERFMDAPAFGPDELARVAAGFAAHGADFAIVLSQARTGRASPRRSPPARKSWPTARRGATSPASSTNCTRRRAGRCARCREWRRHSGARRSLEPGTGGLQGSSLALSRLRVRALRAPE